MEEELRKLIDNRIEELELSAEGSYSGNFREECEKKIETLRNLKSALFGY